MGTAPRKGFNPARKVGSSASNGGMTAYTIASEYSTALGVGDPVRLTTDGTLIKATNAANNVGVISGIKYVDSNGDIKITKYWPASTVATEIEVLVVDDPLQTYHVVADAAIDTTVVFPGGIFAMNITAADAATGRSTMTLDVAAQVAIGASMVKVVKVIDVDNRVVEVVLTNTEVLEREDATA